MALLAIHWLETVETYSATPLARKASIRNSGTCHWATAFFLIRLSSTRGLSRAGSTGSREAAATIARRDRATTLR